MTRPPLVGRDASGGEDALAGGERQPIIDRAGNRVPGFYKQRDRIVFPYRDGRGRQRWEGARTLTEARRRKAALVTDVDRGEHRVQARVGFTTYGRTWVVSYQGRTRNRIDEATRDDYLGRLERDAFPFFGETPLSAIAPADIKAYAAHVANRSPTCRACRGTGLRLDERCKKCGGAGHGKEKFSDNTVRLALAPVKVMFATAFEDGLIRVNPAAGVRVLQPRARGDIDDEDNGPVKALTEKELAAFFAALAAKKTWQRWMLCFRVLLELGLRVGELIELRWRDVDLGAGTVRIRRKFYLGRVGAPKSRFGRRTLRLTPATSAMLWTLRKETKARDGDLVLSAPFGGRVIPSNLMRDVLKPAAIAAGIGDWPGFHTFRHTCATLLFTKAKWNPKQVQIWLGHHSAAFTVDTYIHLLPDDLPDAAELAPTIAAPAAEPRNQGAKPEAISG